MSKTEPPTNGLRSQAAERTWFAISPDGSERDVVIRVGVPTHEAGGEWRAVVSLDGLEDREYAIAGVDAWQAVRLAMRFAAARVLDFAERGWRFYWERGGDLATARELDP